MYSTYFYLFNKIEKKHDSCRLPVYNPQRDFLNYSYGHFMHMCSK